MSNEQVRKLFAELRKLTKVVEDQAKQIEAMQAAVHSAVSNSELVLNGYQEHGTRIEQISRRMERINVRCPLMKPDTNEFEKVDC